MTLSTSKPAQRPETAVQSRAATWAEYLALRDLSDDTHLKISFNQGWLWAKDMGKEGINHARICDLFTMLMLCWAMQFPHETVESLGRCLIEKPETQACAPDLVIYRGNDFPRWQKGELRRIDLTTHRLPDLVGEISDTTLTQDLDEQKRLYAVLGIPEYWVIDVRGKQAFIFRLSDQGEYELVNDSQTLSPISRDLLEQTLERLDDGSNTAAAAWFAEHLTVASSSGDD